MKMPNTKYTGSFIKGGPGENQSYKKYYGGLLKGFKEGGTIRLVRFGDPNMSIKKNIPARRKSFRARHGCDKGKISKLTAKYWSCKAW